jgi:hypothetical protein
LLFILFDQLFCFVTFMSNSAISDTQSILSQHHSSEDSDAMQVSDSAVLADSATVPLPALELPPLSDNVDRKAAFKQWIDSVRASLEELGTPM